MTLSDRLKLEHRLYLLFHTTDKRAEDGSVVGSPDVKKRETLADIILTDCNSERARNFCFELETGKLAAVTYRQRVC